MAPPLEAWANDPVIQDIDKQLERDEEYLETIEDQDLYEAMFNEEGELEEYDDEEDEILFGPEEEEGDEEEKNAFIEYLDVLLDIEAELASKTVEELNSIPMYLIDPETFTAINSMVLLIARTKIQKALPSKSAKVIQLNDYRPPAPRNPVKEKIIRTLILARMTKKKRPQLRLVK